MAVYSANERTGEGKVAPIAALKADGTNYAWRMFFEDNSKIVDADNLDELTDALISGYLDMDEIERLASRIELARAVQINSRLYLLNSLTEEENKLLADWERDILFSGNLAPHGWGVETDEWKSEIPLVLVTTDYRPYTDIAPPIGFVQQSDVFGFQRNVIYLDPSEDESLLRSLHIVSFIAFGKPIPSGKSL